MDDAKKEIEEALNKVNEFLEIANPVADIILVVLEGIESTGITSKAGKILDTVVGELGNVVLPLKNRWDALQKDRIAFLAGQVKAMTGEEELEEATAIEILKIHQKGLNLNATQMQMQWWQNQAKKYQFKLEARNAAEKTSDTVLSGLRASMPWKR